jgi:hypothetical protein
MDEPEPTRRRPFGLIGILSFVVAGGVVGYFGWQAFGHWQNDLMIVNQPSIGVGLGGFVGLAVGFAYRIVRATVTARTRNP